MIHGPWICGPGCPGWEGHREAVLEYEAARQAALKSWLLALPKRSDKVSA